MLAGEIVNTAVWSSGGTAWCDYDNDGFLDLFVANGFTKSRQVNHLYHNDGNSNRWLGVVCKGTSSNRSSLGARVRLEVVIDGTSQSLLREITSGTGFNGSAPRAHFGLGDANTVDHLRVEWPSGTIQELADVAVNQILTLTEPPRLEWTDENTISWHVAAESFRLQSSTQASGPWRDAVESVVVTANKKTVQIATGSASRFFRLVMGHENDTPR